MQVAEILSGKTCHEERGDRAPICAGCREQPNCPAACQLGVYDTSVAGIAHPNNACIAPKSIHKTRDTRRIDAQAQCELRHPEMPGMRRREYAQ
jgi:hypothetical protein